MPFPTQAAPPPARLVADTLLLRPIAAADAEIDHDALMETRDFLRVWEQTGWPADDFSVEDNRADLATLEQRHVDGVAYTYTVLDPTGTRCLGCVYVMPRDARFLALSTITPLTEHRWDDVEAAVYLWVRASEQERRTDRALLEHLRTWFAMAWDLRRVVHVTHEDLAQQVALLADAGLAPLFAIEEPGKQGRYLAYG